MSILPPPRILTNVSRLPEIYALRVAAWEQSPGAEYVNSELFPQGWFDALDTHATARHWVVKDGGRIVAAARVVLNDLSPRGMGLFCSRSMLVGQEVAVTLDEPRRVYLRGRIIWCQEYDTESHVLSQQSYSFRVGIKFVFQSAQEEEAVKAFCEELVKALNTVAESA